MALSAAVLVLSQPSETEVTALTLHHLVRDLGRDTTVHVLMNGGFDGELRALTPASPRVDFHWSAVNLGVAGGRNLLLRLQAVQAADVIVVLDNDVITPPRHVERLVEAVAADPDAGVIGPAVLDLGATAGPLRLTPADLRAPISNERLLRVAERGSVERMWFHLGTHPDWWGVYFDERRLENLLLHRAGADVEPFPAMNHHDPAIRARLADGMRTAIPASNIAGCCQAFRRGLLDEIGYLRDEFSPYGFEDVDFCVRALRAGKRNCVDPSILMLHGTDARHARRRSRAGRIATHRNFMRCKTLLAWHHTGAWRTVVERSILRRYLLSRQAGRNRTAVENLRAHVAGSLDGQRQIRHLTAQVHR
jgi:GT2 family glycosyltransferase